MDQDHDSFDPPTLGPEAGPGPAGTRHGFRRTLLLACLGCALGGMLLTTAFSAFKQRARSGCPCAARRAAVVAPLPTPIQVAPAQRPPCTGHMGNAGAHGE